MGDVRKLEAVGEGEKEGGRGGGVVLVLGVRSEMLMVLRVMTLFKILAIVLLTLVIFIHKNK